MQTYILDNNYHRTLLVKLGDPDTKQPEVSRLIEAIYQSLFTTVVSQELEAETIQKKTRVFAGDSRGVYEGEVFKSDQKVVVVDLIRAGMEPSTLFYHKLTEILNPNDVRLDHIMAQRIDGESGVEDVNLMASKIGGPIEDAIVFLPDPMGATGYSIQKVIEFYLKNHGQPKKFVVVHLVIAPEYLKKLEEIQVPLAVYVARKDGGLTANDYIYPGLGGVGEVISNTVA